MDTTVAIEVSSDGLLATAARRLYDAECAMHQARQSHIDAWIAAAAEKLHRAIGDYLAALPAGSAR